MKNLIRFAALLGLLAPLAFAEDYIESFGDDAYVNWTKGEACATGSGIVRGEDWSPEMKIEAHRAASLDAMRKLVEVINKIHVDSDTTVEQFVENSSTVRKKISGIVRNFTEREVRFTKDGICRVDIYVPINGDGSISEIFLGQADVPRVADFRDDSAPGETPSPQDDAESAPSEGSRELAKKLSEDDALDQTAVPDLDAPESERVLVAKLDPKEQKDKKAKEPAPNAEKPDTGTTVSPGKTGTSKTPDAPVSGLVVDATGYYVRPALNPKIVSDDGRELYGFRKADRDFRRLNGLASYAADMQDACLDRRVIETPYVIEAKGVNSTKPSIVVVSAEDADTFLKNQGVDRVFNRCRVIIVTQGSRPQS